MAVAKNVTGEEIFPVAILENERMTADTIVNTSCNQNPKLPRLLKDLEVFSNFLTTYTTIITKHEVSERQGTNIYIFT